VYVETISRQRSEANDELDLWTWNRDAGTVAVALVHGQRRHSAPGQRARRNGVDDEAPELATLFASVGAQPPDGSNAELARAFDVLLDGRRIREDLGFKPEFPRIAAAIAAGA
jgi:hypothetical protein